MANHGFTDWHKWLDWQIATTAERAFRDMCRDPMNCCYLIYIPGGAEFGELGHEQNNQRPNSSPLWQLATAEPMPRGADLDGLKAWIRKWAEALPILA